MSNSNNTEISRQFGETVGKSVSNIINNMAYGMTGLNFNEVVSNGTGVSHLYTDKTISTGNDFKLMDVGTQPNKNYRYYDRDVFDDIESLYPKIINCSPQYLAVEITKEMILAMNAKMKIKDVEIVVPNKVVKVTFDDNTFEKAVCHEDDQFSLETAITICMTKHLLGGSGKFNNILAKGVKIVEDKVKAAEEAEKEKARIEAKRLKNHNKRVEKRKKKEADARKARIQETAEAIVLANEMMKTEAKNKEDK